MGLTTTTTTTDNKRGVWKLSLCHKTDWQQQRNRPVKKRTKVTRRLVEGDQMANGICPPCQPFVTLFLFGNQNKCKVRIAVGWLPSSSTCFRGIQSNPIMQTREKKRGRDGISIAGTPNAWHQFNSIRFNSIA